MSLPSVIIVGAGISGLSCGSFLARNGVSEIKIVDPRDRIGGRICTVRPNPDDEFFFEAGAQWIHGADGNSVKELADISSIQSAVQNEKKHIYFENEGKRCEDLDKVKKLEEAEDNFNDIIQFAEEGRDIQTHESLLAYLQESWTKKYKNDPATGKLFNVLLNLQNVIEGCDTLQKVNLNAYNQYNYCSGGDLSVTGGLDNILNELSSNIPASSFLLKHSVCKIDWDCLDRQGKVAVHVFDVSSKREEVIYADHVVVTLPLGVLKSNHWTLFSPSLPPSKIKAIESLGFGSVTKVILRYDQQLWDEEPVTMHLLRDEPGQFGHYSALVTKCHANDEYFLTLWLSGEEAVNVEKLPEEKLKKELTDDLRKFIPAIPYPKSIFVTRWRSDPYTCGAYTYISVDSTPRDLHFMAEPLSETVNGVTTPKVLFAGEATHGTFFSTMHGAYDSGVREAQRIVELNRRNTSKQCDKNQQNLISTSALQAC